MSKIYHRFLLIIFLLSLSLVLNFPTQINFKKTILGQEVDLSLRRPEINLKLGPWQFKRDLQLKKGLDLQGGAHLVLQADLSQVEPERKAEAVRSAREVVSRRVDLYGVSESIIQTSQVGDTYRIIVELPGFEDVDKAVDLIGQTAQLSFREPPEKEPEATPSSLAILDFKPTDLTGADLKRASVDYNQDPQNPYAVGQPVVKLEFTQEGREKFHQITKRNVNKQVAIFLDEMPITAPVVNEAIDQGEAIISGSFDVEAAKELAIQLNAGALPVPLKLVEQKTIGATLGAKSVQRSLQAGLVGLALVVIFMIGVYGRLGVVASIALAIYALLTLSIYRLLPVVITLPGLAGFVLSVGMAVDSNILIFERFKEERRAGMDYANSLELAFGRAWDSIKDANVCTLIICFILFNPFNLPFLNSSGMIRGFALTLFLGVVVSLFTGIFVSRTLLRLTVKESKWSGWSIAGFIF